MPIAGPGAFNPMHPRVAAAVIANELDQIDAPMRNAFDGVDVLVTSETLLRLAMHGESLSVHVLTNNEVLLWTAEFTPNVPYDLTSTFVGGAYKMIKGESS